MTITDALIGTIGHEDHPPRPGPLSPDTFRDQDETYVRYMESWPEDEETDDLAPLWAFGRSGEER